MTTRHTKATPAKNAAKTLTENQPIRVMLVDDHRALLEGMVALLNSQDGLSVVGTANDGQAGMKVALTEQPDVALLDIDMPKISGMELAEKLRQQNPDLKIIFFSMYANPIFVRSAHELGARGFLLKEEPFTTVAQAIREVYAGNIFYSEPIRRIALNLGQVIGGSRSKNEQRLSKRERDVIKLMGQGLSLGQTAEQLGISFNTVRTLWNRAQAKLELRPLTQGMVTASVHDQIPPTNTAKKKAGHD